MKTKDIPINKIIKLLVFVKGCDCPVNVIICHLKNIEPTSIFSMCKATFDFMYVPSSNGFYVDSFFYMNADYSYKVEKPTYCEILEVKGFFINRKIKYNRKCMKFCLT